MDYAKKNGMTVIHSYIDRALSGRTDRRPEFQKMIRDTNKKQFQFILIWKFDRFARDRYDASVNKRIAKKNGVKVISVTENIPDDPTGIILESVIDGFSEYFSANLSENVIRGMDERALKCQDNGVPPPPGYMVVDHKYVIDEDMAPLIKRIFEMYSKGFLGREIVAEINPKGFRNFKGNPLDQKMLGRILKNRKYIGEYKWRDIVIPGGVPVIVDEEIFNKVQQRMAKKKHAPATAKAVEPFILTTKLFCGTCSNGMFGDSGTSCNKVKHYYYSCNKNKDRDCDKKSVKKKWIENLVIDRLVSEMFQPKVISEITEQILKKQEQIKSDIPRLTAQKDAVEKKISNIISAVERGMDTVSMQKRLSELEQQKQKVEINIAQEMLEHPKLSRQMILDWFDGFSKGDINSLSYRQLLIDFFVKKIVIYDDKILIFINYENETKDAGEPYILCSDLTSSGTPDRDRTCISSLGGTHTIHYVTGAHIQFCRKQ